MEGNASSSTVDGDYHATLQITWEFFVRIINKIVMRNYTELEKTELENVIRKSELENLK